MAGNLSRSRTTSFGRSATYRAALSYGVTTSSQVQLGGTGMDDSAISAKAREFAAARGILVWDSFPWGGAMARWPEDSDLDGFLAVLERVGSKILYAERGEGILGFAVDGVVHIYSTASARERLIADEIPIGLFGEDERFDEPAGAYNRPDFSDPYYDTRTHEPLAGELRELVDVIVADKRFDGWFTRLIAAEHTAHLDAQDAERVQLVASRVFRETIGKQLDGRAGQVLQSLAADPSYDPLAWGQELREFIESALPGEDPRVLNRLQRDLPNYARESGLIEKARRENADTARRVYESMPVIDRDKLGFASRNAARLHIVEPYLESVVGSKRQHVLKAIIDLEEEMDSVAREARYATAVRRLIEDGKRKADISRRLGITTSAIDRLLSASRSDVTLDVDDPILTQLAPELA